MNPQDQTISSDPHKTIETKCIHHDVSPFTENDVYLFKEGTHFQLYEKLGSRLIERQGQKGVYFAVWAPNASQVSVIGNFNQWNRDTHLLAPRWDSSGIWEGFIPGVQNGDLYKYFIVSQHNGYSSERIDPYSYQMETPPKTASMVWDLSYEWNDKAWMENRSKYNGLDAPISIYEIHLGSWRRKVEEGGRFLTYRELTETLVEYVKEMGYTHVEFLPVMEHPFYGSWGYQTLGYFAATTRYGSPQDLMYLIDCLHRNGIGIILDWVPSHFPSDGHGLAYYDGTCLYEHQDPQKGFHPDWKSYIFNHDRNEIREFLISSAHFWLEKYHIDGLRVDAVASMLYLDYSRNEGEWSPNIYGGRENLEAITFIKQLNESVYSRFPGVQMIAEESTSWPCVSRPTFSGGLGFGMKWNMGWMHDTLVYISKDPVFRKYHQNDLTFSMLYAFTENFVLSISHDEVVHGKNALLSKMPCDDWQKFANLRLLYGYMFAHVGKKLLFMGSEFGQWSEWYHEASLDWHLLEYDRHYQTQQMVKDLNHLYRSQKALYHFDFDSRGFEWIDCSDWQNSILCFCRKTDDPKDTIVVACNFTPTPHQQYRIGVPTTGFWQEIFNTDSSQYGGANMGNFGGVEAQNIAWHGRAHSLLVTLPPLSVLYFKVKADTRDVSSDQSTAAKEDNICCSKKKKFLRSNYTKK